MYCDRRLPAEIRTHEVLLGECLGGALAINDFVRLCQQVRLGHEVTGLACVVQFALEGFLPLATLDGCASR